jgi:hypothetical protein
MDDNEECCEQCGKRFAKWRHDHRFCSTACKDAYWNNQRALAMRAWREALRDHMRVAAE